MAAPEQDNIVCPHCIAPVGPFDHFCPHCGGPVTAHASTDPLGQIHSVGRAYRNASKNPRPIVVVGIWLIFGPQVPILLFGLFLTLSSLLAPGYTYSYGDGSSLAPINEGVLLELIKLLILTGLLVLYCALIGKVTVRYLHVRRDMVG